MIDPLKTKARAKRDYQKHKIKRDADCVQWRKNERLRLINLFGGICSACGEADPIVLDFDHIHNDGHKERGYHIIHHVKRAPERFQLLCKNCNWRKEFWRRRNAQ